MYPERRRPFSKGEYLGPKSLGSERTPITDTDYDELREEAFRKAEDLDAERVQEMLDERLEQQPEEEEEIQETSQEEAKEYDPQAVEDDLSRFRNDGFVSGRFSPGTAADHKAMEILAPLVLAATGKPLVDLGMDLVGKLGGESLNKAWDSGAKFENPTSQLTYEVAGVIVPTAVASMYLGPRGGEAAFRLSGGSFVARSLGKIFTTAGVDVAVTGISDYTDRDEGMVNAIDDLLDYMGNPYGMNIPEAAKIHDDMSPETRRYRLMFEAAGLSLVGDGLGYLLSRGKNTLGWFEAMDDKAKAFKAEEELINPDPYSVAATQQLDEDIVMSMSMPRGQGGSTSLGLEDFQRRSDEITQQMQTNLGPARGGGGMDLEGPRTIAPNSNILAQQEGVKFRSIEELRAEKEAIFFEATGKGFSRASGDPLESYVARQSASRDWQVDEMAGRSIQNDPTLSVYNPDVQANLADPTSNFKHSIPNAAVARNAADIAAMEQGVAKGIPTPVVTAPMLDEGIRPGGPGARKVILDIAQEKSQSGRYNSVVNGARLSFQETEEAPFSVLTKIIEADSVDEVKSFFVNRKDMKTFSSGFKANYMTDPDAGEAAIALQVLTHMYLGEDVAKTSARVMKTLGHEVAGLSETMHRFKGAVDEDKISEVIHDKLAFLFEEYGINKYIAGWSLANKNWWRRLLKGDVGVKTPEEITYELKNGILKAEQQARAVSEQIKNLRKNDPEAAKTLALAFNLTNGDVTTIRQLREWQARQTSLTGMIFSGKDGMNLQAQTLKAIVFNNVLSGMASIRAGFGNAASLVLQPIEYLSASAATALRGDNKPLRAGLYAYNSFWSTQGSALKNAYSMYMQAARDPQSVMKYMRKDYAFGDDRQFELLEAAADLSEREGRMGEAFISRFVMFNRKMSMNPILRHGSNMMLAIDTYTNTMLATAQSRFRAFDEVLESQQLVTPEILEVVAKKHYNDIFDGRGLIKDSWLKHTSGEVALNADNFIADGITAMTQKMPALTPFFMFPRTSINWIRRSLTYMPIVGLIDSRQRKLLKARFTKSDADIAAALAEHGIDMATEPQSRMIFKNLVAMQDGRYMMGSLTAMGLAHYALAGNIRGNYPRSKQDQRFWRENDIQPHMIKIGNVWISYKGIPMLDPILSIVGDLAYNANDISKKNVEDTLADLGWIFAQSFTANSPLQGMNDLVELAGGDRGAAVQRFIANQVKGFIPASAFMGVVAKQIDSTSKQVYGDFRGYIANSIPVLNTTLPKKIDIWTGGAINDIQNPFLRIVNGLSPVKMSGTSEPWRQWLLSSGWNKSYQLRYADDSSYEYSDEEAEIIHGIMGEMQLWKKIDKLSKNPRHNKFLDQMRQVRNDEFTADLKFQYERLFGESPTNPKLVDLPEQIGPVYSELNSILRTAQRDAERLAILQGSIPSSTIFGSRLAKKYLKYGDVRGAREASTRAIRKKYNIE